VRDSANVMRRFGPAARKLPLPTEAEMAGTYERGRNLSAFAFCMLLPVVSSAFI
jgi:hypothetical protein